MENEWGKLAVSDQLNQEVIKGNAFIDFGLYFISTPFSFFVFFCLRKLFNTLTLLLL